jgi:hypothetical protein
LCPESSRSVDRPLRSNTRASSSYNEASLRPTKVPLVQSPNVESHLGAQSAPVRTYPSHISAGKSQQCALSAERGKQQQNPWQDLRRGSRPDCTCSTSTMGEGQGKGRVNRCPQKNDVTSQPQEGRCRPKSTVGKVAETTEGLASRSASFSLRLLCLCILSTLTFHAVRRAPSSTSSL